MKTLLLFIVSLSISFGQSTSKITIVPPQNDSTTGSVDFRERYQNGQNYVGWQAPNNIVNSFRLRLPSTPATINGSKMAFNIDGSQSWETSTKFTDFNWAQTVSNDMTIPGTYTITLTPAPLGVSATILFSQYRIVGAPGTSELVTPTGTGTCDGTIKTSCTLQVTTINPHAANSTISSATIGLQEAWNAGKTNLTCPDGIHSFYGTAYTNLLAVNLIGTANCILAPTTNGMTLISVNNAYPGVFRGFAFNSLGTYTGVTYISLGDGSISNGGTVFQDIRFGASSGGYGIDARRGHELRVYNCLFSQGTVTGGGSAVRIGSIIHGDLWGGWFSGNQFLGDWRYGIEARATGFMAYKNVFNGPKNHIGFLNWISVVDVNGTDVTFVSGAPFDTGWPGFVEINGLTGLIQSVNSPTSITLSNNLGVISGGQLRHGSTGQIIVEGNSFDSGSTWYEGGFVSQANDNSFYVVRVLNNFCTMWLNVTFSNCIYFSNKNVTDVIISANDAYIGQNTGAHSGINIEDIGDAIITNNNINGATSKGIFAGITAANNPKITVSANNIKCKTAGTSYGITIGKGKFNLGTNTVEDCDIGVLGAAAATGTVANTVFQGTVGAHYQFDATSTLSLQDLVGVAFVDLVSNAANGTLLYCSNCTAGSNPCTGASTGAFAKRVNGAWACN